MVLVEDATDNSRQRAGSSESTQRPASSGTSSASTPSSSSPSLLGFLLQDKISSVLLFTRLFSFVATFMFILPIFGFDPNVLYQKALMSSAATSALKLHQRMLNVPFQFSREYLGKLMVEDSFHYLLYSMIFLNSHPVTIVLMPVAAFAVLHILAYTKQLFGVMGVPESSGMRRPLNLILSKDKDIMRFIALCEILLVPTIFVMIFSGKSGIFIPFIYYRFLCMRYSSRRNPYNQIMFREMRIILESYTSQSSCPQIVKNLSQRLINLVTRFAPPPMA